MTSLEERAGHLDAERWRKKRRRVFDIERSTLDNVAVGLLLKLVRLMTLH